MAIHFFYTRSLSLLAQHSGNPPHLQSSELSHVVQSIRKGVTLHTVPAPAATSPFLATATPRIQPTLQHP